MLKLIVIINFFKFSVIFIQNACPIDINNIVHQNGIIHDSD